VRYIFLIIGLLSPLSVLAQITAPGANAVRYTTYPSALTVKDPVFFYCNINGTERGTLTATNPQSSGIRNYNWFKWNPSDNSFSIPVASESGVLSSTISNLMEGGYKVDIDSAGIPGVSFVGWVFFDMPPSVSASLAQQLCYRVALNGDTAATVRRFLYNDINTGSVLSIKNEITFMWSSDPASSIPYPDLHIDPVTYSPPLEDVTYKLTVNSLGCVNESSFRYESIHVKADFTVEPVTGEAPLEVRFTDKSIRGDKYTWKFGDNRDSISYLPDPLPHIYYKPGEYYVTLIIESDRHCIDSMTSERIVVDPSQLSIPNVFTPDGDGYNDRFMVESKSLRSINVEIFSRSGMKVYSFYGEGERLRAWDGWDGNINSSSRKASPGIYFYVIRAYGWDDVSYNTKEQRGFVYLYR
jgi:gliding motility-associated-like protein